MSLPRFLLSACFVLCANALACTPDIPDEANGISDYDAGARTQDAGLDPEPRGYVVISGDYAVTSVSLLKSDGTLLERDFIDSGSASTGLVTALSGDVSLPTRSGEHGVLVLLDRFRTDVITRIDLASGKILGQVKTHAPNTKGTSAYSSNPHDYVYIDTSTAWVSRYEPNPSAKQGDPDFGIDLIRIDPTSFTRTEDRINFSSWNSKAERKNPDTGETESVTVYARPSSLVHLGNYLVVGIDSLSLAFDAITEGMVALVDLDTKKVKMLKLPGLQSCGDLSPVPDDMTHVAVGCTGFFLGKPRDGAGIAMLALEDGELHIEHTWHASEDPKSALTMYSVSPIDSNEVFAIEAGKVATATTPETHDKLYRLDLRSGEQTKLLEATSSYVLGSPSYDPRTHLVLVPDASTDDNGRPSAGIHRFELKSDRSFKKLGITKIDDVLPARQIRAFD